MTRAEITKSRALIANVVEAASVLMLGASTREEIRQSEDRLFGAVQEWRKYRATLGTKYNYDVVEKALGMEGI